MKKLILLSFIIFSVALTSCTTVNKSSTIANTTTQGVQINPIGASIDMDNIEKVSGKANAFYFLGLRLYGDKKFIEIAQSTSESIFKNRTKRVQAAALYNATRGVDVDVLLSPKYETTMGSYLFGIFRTYNVQANAYAAKIQEMRQYEHLIGIQPDANKVVETYPIK